MLLDRCPVTVMAAISKRYCCAGKVCRIVMVITFRTVRQQSYAGWHCYCIPMLSKSKLIIMLVQGA